jgi:predicted MFS family arabinose efflux permease
MLDRKSKNLRRQPLVSAGNVAFICLFAAQAGLLTLGPILPDVARDFGVSTAGAGQLRTLAGLVGGIAALTVVLAGKRIGLRRLLLVGNGLLGLGSVASAAAQSFAALAAAQVAVGAATGLLVSGGLAAAASWAPPKRRAETLAWASLGQPASWVAGMPLIGATADLGWRYAWLGVPLAAAVAGFAALRSWPREERADTASRAYSLRWDAKLVGWTVGELLAYAGWGGVLVYAGALLLESYGASAGTVGLVLGGAAIAAFPGNFIARRWLAGSSRELLVVLGLVAASITAVFGAVRPGLGLSSAIFALLVLTATTRTVAGSTFALYVTPERRLAVMGVRALTGQLGYLFGAALGGAALAYGGYALLGATLATLFALGASPHVATLLADRAALPRPGMRLVPRTHER